MTKTMTKTPSDSENRQDIFYHLRETILGHAYDEASNYMSFCFMGEEVMFDKDDDAIEYKFPDYLEESDLDYEISIKLTYKGKEVDLSKFD